MSRKATIETKILRAISILIVGYFLSMGFGFISGSLTEDRLKQILQSTFPATQQAQTNLFAFNEADALAQNAMLLGEASNLEQAEARLAAVSDGLRTIDGLTGASSGSVALQVQLQEYAILTREVFQAMAEMLLPPEELQTRAQDLAQKNETIRAALQREADAYVAALNTSIESIQDSSRNGRFMDLGVFILVVLAGGITVFVVIRRGVVNPINSVVTGLRAAADLVGSSSRVINQTSDELADGSSEQAASIEETSSSLEELSSMTSMNADNARRADSVTNQTAEVVKRASISIGNLTKSMSEIAVASTQTQRIVKTIDEIAFQTNILALNAAVEAARAGEAGAGFAVVADEVRNLALRAAEAARNTADLIEQSSVLINRGVTIADDTQSVFRNVEQNTAEVSTLVSEIASASVQQASGLSQINSAVASMDVSVQRNAANSQEAAEAARGLDKEAQRLDALVGHLIELVRGSRKAAPEPADKGNKGQSEPGRNGTKKLHLELQSPSRDQVIRTETAAKSGRRN